MKTVEAQIAQTGFLLFLLSSFKCYKKFVNGQSKFCKLSYDIYMTGGVWGMGRGMLSYDIYSIVARNYIC